MTQCDLIALKMHVNFHMFCVLMMNMIVGQVDSRKILTTNESGARRRAAYISKELMKPCGLSNNTVFNLSTGARRTSLGFRGPRNQIRTKIDTIAGGGTACVILVGIRKSSNMKISRME